MITPRLILPALFLALSATATAQEGPHGDRLQELDANNDGAISLEEANAKRLERFASTDTNNDGAITPAEIEAAMERRRAERFGSVDTDGNGAISQAEFLASDRGGDIFERLDANDDGLVSAEEMAAGRPARRGPPGRGRRGARPAAGGTPSGSGS